MKRRKFLKTMSIMAAAMYADLPTFAQNVSQMGKEKLKVGILSDIHITDAESAKTFRHALEYFRDRHADGVIIAGDMADWGIESQLKIVADTWFEVFPEDRLPDGQHIENGEDRYGVRLPQIEVIFPSVLKKRTGVRATDYEVRVEQAFLDTITITHTKRVYSNGFYLGEAQDEKDVTCLFGKHELPKNRKWRFAVLPCESFGKKGAAIYSEWQEPIKQ